MFTGYCLDYSRLGDYSLPCLSCAGSDICLCGSYGRHPQIYVSSVVVDRYGKQLPHTLYYTNN